MQAMNARYSLLSVVVAALVAALPIVAVMLVCSDDPAAELPEPALAAPPQDLDHH